MPSSFSLDRARSAIVLEVRLPATVKIDGVVGYSGLSHNLGPENMYNFLFGVFKINKIFIYRFFFLKKETAVFKKVIIFPNVFFLLNQTNMWKTR